MRFEKYLKKFVMGALIAIGIITITSASAFADETTKETTTSKTEETTASDTEEYKTTQSITAKNGMQYELVVSYKENTLPEIKLTSPDKKDYSIDLKSDGYNSSVISYETKTDEKEKKITLTVKTITEGEWILTSKPAVKLDATEKEATEVTTAQETSIEETSVEESTAEETVEETVEEESITEDVKEKTSAWETVKPYRAIIIIFIVAVAVVAFALIFLSKIIKKTDFAALGKKKKTKEEKIAILKTSIEAHKKAIDEDEAKLKELLGEEFTEKEEKEKQEKDKERSDEAEIEKIKQEANDLWLKYESEEEKAKRAVPGGEKKAAVKERIVTQEDIDKDPTIEEYGEITEETNKKEDMGRKKGFFPEDRFGN